MIKKLFLNQQGKVKTGFWLLDQDKSSRFFFYLLILFLPTQLGRHFWPDFSFVYGLRLDYLSPTLYLTDIFIFFIFLFSAKKLLTKIKKNHAIIFVLFFLSIILAAVTSKNPYAGYFGLIKFLELSFLSLYILKNAKNFNRQIIFFCFLTGLIFESSLSFLQFFNQGSIGSIFYFFGERLYSSQTPGIANAAINGGLVLRPYATFSHPNVLAGYLICAMIYLLIFINKEKKEKIFLFLGIIIGTVSLFLTLSRAAIILWIVYLIFVFGFFIYEKYKKGKSNLKILSLILFSISIFIIVLSLFKNTYLLQRFTATNFSDESIIQREQLIGSSIDMFLKNPVLGVGINNFYNSLALDNINQSIFFPQPVHNIFLLVLSETGIVGLVFFIAIFVKALLNILKINMQKRKYFLMLLFSFFFLGMFDHYFLTLQQGQILFTIFISLAISYKNI